MAQRPSTPVRVPSSAANHTPATLDPDLRSHINTVLLRDGHVSKIQDALLHALNANPSNWPTAIQSHALTLLRSGEITTFPALLRRVLDDIRHDSGVAGPSTNGSGAKPGDHSNNGSNNGNDSAKNNDNNGGRKTNGAQNQGDGKVSLAVPGAVVEEALRATRECLEAVCEIDDKA